MRKGAVALIAMALAVTLAQAQTDMTVTRYDSMEVYLKTRELEDVSVVHQAPVVKLKTDKVTYQVENDADAKTRTVLEMLRKVPMVTVDGRNNITVNGSAQFKVYVDGRLNNLITRNPTQMLRNMPASSVKSIEVVTNPGAQYDAEGAGGVLLITTKKSDKAQDAWTADAEGMEGAQTNGSVHATAGTMTWGMDASLSTQRGRWSYDLNLNGEYMYSTEAEMESETVGTDSRQWMRQGSTSKMPFTMAETRLGFEIDSVQSLHANLSLMWFGMQDRGNPAYLYSGGMWGNQRSFGGRQEMTMNDLSLDGSIDYQRQWQERGRLLVNYQFSHNPSQNDSENRYEGLTTTEMEYGMMDNRSEVREHNTSHQLTTDVTLPLAERQLLNVGLKLTTDRSESDAREMWLADGNWQEHTEGSVHYRQHQYITALYAEWEARWGWFGLKNGYRYEHTWQDSRYLRGQGSDFSLDYGDLVPSLSLTAEVGEGKTLGLNYNQRIRRPRINELDPYVNHSDPTQWSYGNPHLDAQHLNHLAAVYTFASYKLALSLSLRHGWSNDAIAQYSQLVDGRIHTTYGNVAQNRTTSLNLFTSWSITGATRLLLSGDAGYADMRSPKIDAHNYGWHANANLGLQQTLPWQIKWNTNLEWMSRRQTLQGWTSGMTMLSSSLTRSFCNDRWNIALSGMTGLGHGGKMVWKSVTRNKDFVSTSTFVDSMQDITLGITYTFGGKQDMFDGLEPGVARTSELDMEGGRGSRSLLRGRR